MDLGICIYCGGDLGEEWLCHDVKCRKIRTDRIERTIAETRERGLYEISEHLTNEIDL